VKEGNEIFVQRTKTIGEMGDKNKNKNR